MSELVIMIKRSEYDQLKADNQELRTQVKSLSSIKLLKGPLKPGGRPRRIDYLEAVKMRTEGSTIREIAQRFDVSTKAIEYVLRMARRENAD